jgi:RND family efflux transporter MFP subunit
MVGDEDAVVGAKVAGRVKAVKVDLGSVVRRNDVLAELDSAEFELRVLQAQAQLAQACAAIGRKPEDPPELYDRFKAPPVMLESALVEEARANVERSRDLYKRMTITYEELQQREALLAVAQARRAAALNSVDEKIALIAVRRQELALAQQELKDATIVAPFDGIIAARQAAVGSYLNVGQPVVSLVRTNPLRFRAGIPERHAMQLRVGQSVRVLLEGQSTPRDAKIDRISPALELGSRSLAIEADVGNADFSLRAGLFAEAEIIVDPDDRALAVPASAVTEFAGVEKVWRIVDGQAKEQRIRTGRRNAELVEVLNGLAAGEQVIAQAIRGRAGTVTIIRDESTTAGGGQ